MASFQNIALLGKGLVGSFVLQELVNSGFSVTLLSRSEGKADDLPAGVKLIAVDYNSQENLESALQGQDVVVSTISGAAVPSQKVIIDAAIKAGVKRFIPSDFGGVSTDPAAAHLPQNIPFVEIQKYLRSKASEIEWTIFAVGAFTDFVVNSPLFFDWENKSAELWEKGNTRLSTTSIAGAARAIAGALKNREETKNRVLYVHEMVITQAQVLELAKKYSPGVEWKISYVEDSDAELERLIKKFTEESSLPNLLAVLKGTALSGKYHSSYDKVDNNLVGLTELTEDVLDGMFARQFKQ
ncbi:hypothetical protein FANTH_13124 [Fusarium anthophilum]|uniref:NAD(P)-binding domain-containing protein n=1 Tax=Fusarium anthophilum TaxID=48485 RepID=A0A8H4YQ99_9HYPO|nr:hypothetical protein FANTH_13124 [Fusarium anthophilum]